MPHFCGAEEFQGEEEEGQLPLPPRGSKEMTFRGGRRENTSSSIASASFFFPCPGGGKAKREGGVV